MNELLDLTGKIDTDTISTLSAVDQVTSALELPYLIVGATARDLVLHHGYGTPIRRATYDIDFAVQVESWERFYAVKDSLLTRGFVETRLQHRLKSPAERLIDIVPFGGIEQDNAEIYWPPNGEHVMNMRGFKEAIENAQLVLLRTSPELVCRVVTPEGLMILKLICWAERARELRAKDANDIQYLLTTYYSIKNIKVDIYEQDNIAETERYDWDQTQAACSLLGKACRKIVSEETFAEIQKLCDSANDKNIERIAEEMTDGSVDSNLKLLEAFMNGFKI